MIIGRNFAEGYYEDERLYSTGYDELDELLERAFCEGYEYAQYEFSDDEKDEEEDDERRSSKAKKKYKRHAIEAGALATTGAGIYGADKLGKHLSKKGASRKNNREGLNLIAKGMKDEAKMKQFEKEIKEAERLEKLGKGLSSPAEFIRRGGRAAKAGFKAAAKR